MTRNPAKQPPGSRSRGRKPAAEEERKDRVIQTRVPKDLESTLKEAAERKRMTVSHLIRNVLEDTFYLVDGIVADSSALMQHVTRDTKKLTGGTGKSSPGSARQPTTDNSNTADAQALLDGVEAWQEVIVNKPNLCSQCSSPLKRGKRAYRGLSNSQGAASAWLCSSCIKKL